MNDITQLAVIWYALGVANVGYLCKEQGFLALCDAIKATVLMPITEIIPITLFSILAVAFAMNWQYAAGIGLIVASGFAALVLVVLGVLVIDEKLNFCRIIWKKP